LQSGPAAKLSTGGKVSSRALNPAIPEDTLFDDRILGSGCFVEEVLDASQLSPEQKQPAFSELIRQVAGHFQIDPSVLKQPSKKRNIVKAKAVICHVAVRQLQIKGVEVAERLGYTSAAVSHATKRGEIILAEEDTLGELLNKDGKLKI
ncbi:MAG: hypothetical protein IMY82_04615, partial [Chloroflexi bacterium]|nr:hypothetical protein [Chloroflexota bacterium]